MLLTWIMTFPIGPRRHRMTVHHLLHLVVRRYWLLPSWCIFRLALLSQGHVEVLGSFFLGRVVLKVLNMRRLWHLLMINSTATSNFSIVMCRRWLEHRQWVLVLGNGRAIFQIVLRAYFWNFFGALDTFGVRTASGADTLADFSIWPQQILTIMLFPSPYSSVLPTDATIVAQLTFCFFKGLIFELGVLLLLLHLMMVRLLHLGRWWRCHLLRGCLFFSFASMVLVPFKQVVRTELFPFGSHHQCRLHRLLLVKVLDLAKHDGLDWSHLCGTLTRAEDQSVVFSVSRRFRGQVQHFGWGTVFDNSVVLHGEVSGHYVELTTFSLVLLRVVASVICSSTKVTQGVTRWLWMNE